MTPNSNPVTQPLDRRVGILNQQLEVRLVPLASLRRRLVGVGLTAELVKSDGRGVGGTIRLATRLDPDKGVGMGAVDIGRRERAKASIDDVAPVSPLQTTARVAGAARVDDGVARHAGSLELGAEELQVELLVLGLVVLGIGVARELAGGQVPLVPARDVDSDTTELRGAAGVKVDLSELLGTRLEVIVPAQPAAVTSVDVLHNVGQVQGRDGVGHTLAIASSRVLARLEVDVGDEVGERVGLNDQGEGLVGVGLDDVGDGWRACQRKNGRRHTGIGAVIPSTNSVL